MHFNADLDRALDELAVLPPQSLAQIPTLRKIHARLRDANCPDVLTQACVDERDFHAPPCAADVDRLHEIFDACARGGTPSAATHYAEEVCGDSQATSDDATEAYVRDGRCVLDWVEKSLRRAESTLDAGGGREESAEACARTLDACARAAEALGADASGKGAIGGSEETKRLQKVRDAVVCRELQCEAVLWAAREGMSDAGGRHGGPAAWAGAVQRRRAATSPGTTFLDDLLAGVGEHRPAYPFKSIAEAAKSIFVDGSAGPAALLAKRCLFLYFLLDSGLPHDGSPMEYARRARIHPRLYQETRAAVLLDDFESEAALDEACEILPRVAHPLLPVKFIASLANRQRPTTALMVSRARGALTSSPNAETMSLEVSIRLACGLISEAFLCVRDAFNAFPELRESKAGTHLVRLLLDHGVEKLCLEQVLALPFNDATEKLLLDLLWDRREDIPVEFGIVYLLNRGRPLEAAGLFSRARNEGRLVDERAGKLEARLQECLARLPTPQKALVADIGGALFADAAIPRDLVVDRANDGDLNKTANAMALADEKREFQAVLRGKPGTEGEIPFLKPPVELAQKARASSLDQATSMLASASILGSPGRPLTFVRPHEPSDAPSSPATMLPTTKSGLKVPESTPYASPFGAIPVRRPAHADASTTTTMPKPSAPGSLLFGAQRPLTGKSSFPAFLSPTPRKATRALTTDRPTPGSTATQASPARRSSRLADRTADA